MSDPNDLEALQTGLAEARQQLAQAQAEIAGLEAEQQRLLGQLEPTQRELDLLRQSSVSEVAQQEEKFRSLFEQSFDGIFLVDAQGHILEWNASLEKITGRSKQEVIGRDVIDVRVAMAPPEYRTPEKAGRLRELAAGSMAPSTSRLLPGVVDGSIERPDGTRRLIQEVVFPILTSQGVMLCGITRDVTERKQAEAQQVVAQEALAASQQRLQALFQYSLDAIVLTDDDAEFVAVNPAAGRLFGYAEEELQLSTVCDITPWHDRKSASKRFQQFLVQGQQQGGYVVQRKDGTRIDVEYQAVANILPGLHMSIIRDVTERKRSEEALRESELLYRSIFENGSDGIIVSAPDGTIFSVNPAGCGILGRSEAEICKIGRAGILDTGDPALVSLLEERTSTGHARSQVTAIHKNGTRFPIDVSSSNFRDKHGNLRTVIIFRDATEQARAFRLLEERVQERTRELTALLEISRNVTSTLDLEPLLQTLLDQLRSVLQYTSAGIGILEGDDLMLVANSEKEKGQTHIPVRIPLDANTPLRVVLDTQAPLVVDDLRKNEEWVQNMHQSWTPARRAANTQLPSWLGAPLIAKGKLIGLLQMDHVEPDRYTEDDARLALAFANQAALAIENARLYQEARHAASLEERHRLARDLHDSISQALYGIVLGASTARARIDTSPDTVVEPLDYVLSLASNAFTEMRALIFELLPSSIETQGLTGAVKHYVQVLRARHGLRITLDLCPEPPVAPQIKEAFYRIAQEALNNITKHARATVVNVTLSLEDDRLCLRIADNGMGFNSDDAFPGHLGLTSMRERAESLGGTFILTSDVGLGTSIYVEAPAISPEDTVTQRS